MPGAPGFQKYPQKKAPNPQELGVALMRMGQQRWMEEQDPMEMEQDMDADDPRRPRPRGY